MKIRCGSHQQNRSIVRPGLSLMAAKVALTAEEFRENSQRSIALFNTEKLSTNSTHVLKSAYCNSVHFCRCNLHGACGGKEMQTAAAGPPHFVAICTERVEAKRGGCRCPPASRPLQSARSVWRQSLRYPAHVHDLTGCNLHGACGGKGRSARRDHRLPCCNLHGACGGKDCVKPVSDTLYRCNLHGACGGKGALQFHPYY